MYGPLTVNGTFCGNMWKILKLTAEERWLEYSKFIGNEGELIPLLQYFLGFNNSYNLSH